MNKSEWLICLIRRNKTRLKIQEDTKLKNFSFYCLSKQKKLIVTKDLQVIVIKELEANEDQSKKFELAEVAL